MEQIVCFFCTKVCQDNDVIYNVSEVTMLSSERPLHLVLQHLANRIQIQLVFGDQANAYICERCFQDLQDYDRLMSDLLTTQKRLTLQLKQAIGITDVDESHPETGNGVEQLLPEEMETTISLNLDHSEKRETINNPDKETTTIPPSSSGEVQQHELGFGNMEHVEEPFDHEEEEESEGQLKRPLRECELCLVSFRTKNLLQQHINEFHKRKRFVCPICGVIRKDEEYLDLHMNLHEGKTEYECRYCAKRFSRPVNTLRHMRIHWDKKKFQCEKCGQRFSLDNMLYNHRMLHDAEENPIICSVCKNTFKSRKTYNHHVRIHQADRPRFHCHLCPKSFTERYTLKMHLRNHELRDEAGKEGTETNHQPESLLPSEDIPSLETASSGTRDPNPDNSVLLLISMPDNEEEYVVCN